MVMKFDPQGRETMLLGRKAESENVPARAQNNDGAGQPTDLFSRPTDVAWDAAGNIFVADGAGNARVAKFDKDGKFVKSWGKRGAAPGEFANVMSIAVDADGNVYAADGGNKRVQVFDNNGTFKTALTGVGNARALCLTKGPNPVLYVSNSNPPEDIDSGGEIYKMRLDGTIIGKFGRAGKLMKEFGTVNAIDCRTENSLYIESAGAKGSAALIRRRRCNKNATIPTYKLGRQKKMRAVISVVQRLGQILNKIVEVRLPMSVWLGFATMTTYRTRF
jgi:hypothetical protein